MLYYKHMSSIVGKLKLVSTDNALVAILWEHDKPGRVKLGSMNENNNHPVLHTVEKELSEYFSNKRKQFTIPFKFNGTEFQQKVWHALAKIPYGQTVSYSDIAF